MTGACRILVLEDEPLILMDLEFAAEDRGCAVLASPSCAKAMAFIEENAEAIDVAILDVSLGEGVNCMPVAEALDKRGIPYVLHSGDLDRQDEQVRGLKAELIAKPAEASHVVGKAIALADCDCG